MSKYAFFAGLADSSNQNATAINRGIFLFSEFSIDSNTYTEGTLTQDTPNFPISLASAPVTLNGTPTSGVLTNWNGGSLNSDVNGPISTSNTSLPSGKFLQIGVVNTITYRSATGDVNYADWVNASNQSQQSKGLNIQYSSPGNQNMDTDTWNVLSVTSAAAGETVANSHFLRCVYRVSTSNLARLTKKLASNGGGNGICPTGIVLSGNGNALSNSDADEKAANLLLGYGYGLLNTNETDSFWEEQ